MKFVSLRRHSGIQDRDSAFLRGHYYAITTALVAEKGSKTSDNFDLRGHGLLLEAVDNGVRDDKKRRVKDWPGDRGAFQQVT